MMNAARRVKLRQNPPQIFLPQRTQRAERKTIIEGHPLDKIRQNPPLSAIFRHSIGSGQELKPLFARLLWFYVRKENFFGHTAVFGCSRILVSCRIAPFL